MRRIGARYIATVTGGIIENGVVTIDDNGVITAVDDGECDEFHEGVIVPGFVNLHCHLELSYMKDVLPSGTGLPGFIKLIMESKSTFPEEVQREAIAKADKLMWDRGVQAVGDISNTTTSFDTKVASGIKYVTFLEIFDVLFGGNDYASIITKGKHLSQQAKAAGLEAYVTPHATYSVSDGLFKRYSSMPNTEAFSIHYMESADDDLLFAKQGKFWSLFQEKGFNIDFLNDGGSTARIVNNIPSDRRALLIHNSNVKDCDIEAMTKHYTNVSWALCPNSNLYIEGKLPPAPLLSSKGANVGIGTDSLSSNTDLNMVAEMNTLRQAYDLSFEQVLSWATINGAKALGLDKEMGSIEVGKRPGLVLMDSFDATDSRRLH